MAKNETHKNPENEMKKEVVKEIKEKILDDLNKEIKISITNNTSKFKEELKEELTNDIQNEVANIMKQEERRIIKGKNFSVFKRDVVILILLGICFYFGYCLFDAKYFDFMKSECEKNGTCTTVDMSGKEEDPNKPGEVIKDKDWYIEHYGYLLESSQAKMNADQVNAYYLYSGDHSLNEMKTSYLLNLAYSKLEKKAIKTNTQSITVSGEDLMHAFENLFGSTNYYKPGTFTYDCLTFKYNQDKDRYTASNTKCSVSNKEIVEEIDNMYEDGDVLYLITVATIYDKVENTYYSFDDLYDPVASNVTENDVLANAKKLNRYQYQYKKVEDTYYLDSITKLK